MSRFSPANGCSSTVLVAITLALAAGSSSQADEIRFARYPHVSNDGRVAFCYHGDIWVAEAGGSNPRRLTAHIASDQFPRFSPDGTMIAFTSNRLGNDDIWIVDSTGGEPRPLTFDTTGDTMLYWTPDGEGVVFATSRGADPWGSPLYVARLDGSVPTPLGMDRGAAGMISQDGSAIAFNRIGFRYWRQHYRGNNNTDVYVQTLPGGEIKQLTDLDLHDYRNHTQDAYPMWGADGMVYFMSERDGLFNIWRIDPAGGEPAQVTRHERDGIQYPSISPDGTTIAYEADFQLWTLNVPGGRPQHVPVDMAFDPKENLVEYLSSDNEADGFAASPDGERVAIDYHGEIFIVPVDPETGEKVQVTASPWRDQSQNWSPDGKHIAYLTDATHDEEIWLYDVESGGHRQLTTQPSLKSVPMWSPQSDKLVFEADQRIHMADVESGELTELAHNPEGGYNIESFSKDGRWLVYTRGDENLNSDVYLFEIATQTEHRLTENRSRERGGYLTHDGKTVLFTSDRDGTTHLYALSLQRLTEDPDDPLVRAKKKESGNNGQGGQRGQRNRDETKDEAEQDEAGGDQAGEEAAAQDDNTKDVIEVKIDTDGLDRRPRRLTSGDDGVGSFFLAGDGKKVYFTRGNALFSIDPDGRNEKKVADGNFGRGSEPSPDGKYLFYREGRGVGRLTLSGGKKEPLDFAVTVKVDTRAEWEQVFEESWRVMKYRFYDENMHGYDWDAIKKHYKPYLAFVGENQDLYDLCNEMIGELNASHTGVSGQPTRSMERLYSTQSLGFEMQPRNGDMVVTHIHRDGPADKEWLDLNAGDIVLSIEGEEISPEKNYADMLNHLLNDYADVMVRSPETGSEPRHLRIRAIGSTRNLQYEEWVHTRREMVDEWSGGKVGYLHIRSMNQSSLAKFEEEVDKYWNKNGMIIDIRFNGGGNIDQQLIDILERRPYEYWNFRQGGRAAGRRPRQAIAGPKVMLINWRSASDSEVTPQGFRDLGLGRIVGNPTYGAVIATGSYRLLNGGSIRTPGSLVTTYDPSQPYNYGINLENFGVAPDVWAENTPQDELNGFDRELKAAVDEALRMLAEDDWQFGEDD